MTNSGEQVQPILAEHAQAIIRHENWLVRHESAVTRHEEFVSRHEAMMVEIVQSLSQTNQILNRVATQQAVSQEQLTVLTADITELRNTVSDFVRLQSGRTQSQH